MKIPQDMIPGTIHETKKYGKLEVLSYEKCNQIKVRFFNTGYERFSDYTFIRHGDLKDPFMPFVKGVGFYGEGKYKARENNKMTDAYAAWANMLQRCYCKDFHVRQPTYIDAEVCSEWHNFQVFAEWFYENYPTDGKRYELDKDIKLDGNKIYSPDLCVFVSRAENMEKSNCKKFSFKSPDGERFDIYNLNKFCRERGLHSGCMGKVHMGKATNHKGWTKV